jgi:hypothetical protein
MRNELMIFAGLLIALIVGSMLYHSRGGRSTGAGHVVSLGSGGAADFMREDFMRTSAVKTSVAEYYVSQGKMPQDNKQAGLFEPPEYRGQTLRSVTVSPDGTIDYEFDANSGVDGGHVLLLPDLTHAQSMGPQWRCVSHDYSDIARAIPTCAFEKQ